MIKHVTLEMMARSMRGIPRNAVMLIRLPDGQLVDLDNFEPMHYRTTDDGAHERSQATMASATPGAHGANYAVVLVPKLSPVTE